MASPYVNIYKDAEGKIYQVSRDGTAVSMGNSYEDAIRFALDAEQNESKTMKCAIRTEAGYIVKGVVISDLNDKGDRFKLCKTSDGTFTDEITFTQVTAVNSIFYVKGNSVNIEQPQTDRSVKLRYTGKLMAV